MKLTAKQRAQARAEAKALAEEFGFKALKIEFEDGGDISVTGERELSKPSQGVKLYTKDQIKRACQQAGEDLHWQTDRITKEVLDNLTALEELEPVTEVHI